MPNFDYIGPYTYHLTFVTHYRQRRFEIASAAELCIELITRAARERHFDILAYAVMPDHVHTVVRGSADDSELLGFAKLFKQLTGYHLKTSNESTLWQQSYHDRLLYTEDEVSEAVEYVLNNPLTDGLAQTRGEYRWVGGSYAEHG